ncbi:RimK/LysX family protein [Sphingobacterium sp. SRCM116780]|uniref:ATP-dependent zinc protease family protein n=1 Tax=Sphingobacterium sp. SRCM116780 TaxID=2907623 RepID=UPI001F264433|nr:RimK/LysX family protein [Sphingobacterium sp. SRCM116780]UIR57205.1 RimK/LysX family protein [Sphingobacterium sp. SRCM116780]
MKDKLIVGWKESIDLPELGIHHIEAKVDTGAGSSVLHCESYEIEVIDHQEWIICHIVVNFKTRELRIFKFPVYKEKIVKSSFGHQEKRYYILTKAKLYNQLFDIKLSFRNRSSMRYPMLLGKNFLYKNFIVDVSKSNLSQKSLG